MRLIKICFVFSKYLVFHKVTKHGSTSFGDRLRYACEDLGLTFVKLGQMLSMRYDLLREEHCKDLQKLLDRTNPVSFEEIKMIVESDLKRPLNEVFKEFYEEPLGSASISQVHKAVLHDGRIVAVKVKRRNVDRHIKSDMRVLKFFAGAGVAMSRTARGFQSYQVVKSFERWLAQDVDFQIEANSIKKLREQEDVIGDIRHGELMLVDAMEGLCTQNVIVMDFVDGIPASRKEEILENEDYDAEKSVRNYVNVAIGGWFSEDLDEYYFQADPHLSNVIFLPNGGVANIDSGLVFRLTKKEVKISRKMIVAIYLKDAKQLANLVIDMCNVSKEKYEQVLREDFRDYFEKTDDEGLGFWFFEITKILVKRKIKYPTYLIGLGRANVVLDGLIATYMPKYRAIDLIGNQLSSRIMEDFDTRKEQARFLRLQHAFMEKINDFTSSENFDDFTEKLFPLISDFSSALRGKYKN